MKIKLETIISVNGNFFIDLREYDMFLSSIAE